MRKFILMSMLGALSMIGKGQIVVNTSSDTVNVSSSGQTMDDLSITGTGPYTAGGNSGNPDPNWYLHGYNVSSGVEFVNKNTINTNGKYDNAVLLNNKSEFTNSGTININGQSSLGVLSADGTAKVTNSSSGVINVGGGGMGIATKGYSSPNFTGTIQNDGSIIGTGGGAGIMTYGSQNVAGGTVINNGTIKINGGTNATGVTISGYARLENNGEISGSGTTNTPSNALVSGNNGAQIHNAATGTITGKSYSTGIYSQNNSITNKNTVVNDGTISVENGYGIYSLGSDITNNGIVSSNGTGIYATRFSNGVVGSTVTNNGTVIVKQNGTGIAVIQGSGVNNGTIQISGNNTTGISIHGGGGYAGTFTNNSSISSDAGKTGVTLVKINGSTAVGDKTGTLINTADLTALGDNSTVIYVTNNGKISNTGNITVNNGTGIKLEYSSLLAGDNKGTITVNGSGIGILAGASSYNGSILVNDGTINLQSNGTGICVASGTAYMNGTNAENKGKINFNGTGGTGIYVTDAKTTFKNSAELISDQRNTTGITVTKTATTSNNADITLTGDNSVGINIINNGVLTSNTGTITVNNGIGIKVKDSTLSNNQNTGIIKVEAENGTGISGVNSNITNNGVIYVKNAGLGFYGNNSDLKNYRQINVTDGTGIAVENNSVLSNNASLNITGEGTGITGISSNITNQSTGNITVKKGTNISASNSTVKNYGMLSNENGTGIYGNNSDVENYGTINIENGTGAVVENRSLLVNNASFDITGEGTGIVGTNSTITNQSTGNITVKNGTGLHGNDSYIENYGYFNITEGTGIVLENNSFLRNDGTVNAGGTGVSSAGSVINNLGVINSKTGITSENSVVLNSGVINAVENGIYASNNVRTVNTGEINGKTGVIIDSGTEEYSGHFLNTGKISGTDFAIKFSNGDNVLELGNGSQITGKIAGSNGENVLIINGNAKIDEASNFTKLVSYGNSIVTGTINLSPSTNDYYYTEAFGTKKDLHNVSGDSSLGELTVNGTINVGVNYDNIRNETDKTGKIIVDSLNLQNGKVVLTNGGITTNNIITESGMTAHGNQIRVKSIIISSKQQAVNPDFKFQVSGGMAEKAGWSRETVARLENGVTVLDEVYTNHNRASIMLGEPESRPEPMPRSIEKSQLNPIEPNENPFLEPAQLSLAEEKLNSVPRNRIDLDNVNRIDSMSNRFLQMESKNMNVGEQRLSIEYIGTKAGSDFKAENEYNYGYNVDSDGAAGTILNKFSDNLYSGATFGYTNNEVKYSNNDNEKVDSLNINVFGRYEKGNWDFDGHAGYGYNKHTLEADWLGAGIMQSDYDSHVLKTGASLGYNQKLGNSGINLRPNLGLDYVLVSEGTMKTNGMSDIQSTSGTGFVGKAGIDIGSENGKFAWNAGIGYSQNFTDTFHKDRNMSNGYVMEELHYGKGSFSSNVNIDYKVTDKFTFKTGYEYEKNSNYENHKIQTGISYVLGER